MNLWQLLRAIAVIWITLAASNQAICLVELHCWTPRIKSSSFSAIELSISQIPLLNNWLVWHFLEMISSLAQLAKSMVSLSLGHFVVSQIYAKLV